MSIVFSNVHLLLCVRFCKTKNCEITSTADGHMNNDNYHVPIAACLQASLWQNGNATLSIMCQKKWQVTHGGCHLSVVISLLFSYFCAETGDDT